MHHALADRIQSAKRFAPGVALCVLIAVPATLLGGTFEVVGAPIFAIIFGIALAFLLRKHPAPAIRAGVGFTSKYVLQCAVVLLGFGMNLGVILAQGAQSLPIIVATISISLVTAFILCRALNIPGKISVLIGVGSSICGGSAIAATAPVIKANDEEIAQAISVIFLFNVIAALIFPVLGSAIGLSNEGFALFAGTAVNDTSSVTAAAATWDGMHPGANTLDGATVVKLTRTLGIIPITLALALWLARKERRAAQAHGSVETKASRFSLKRAFPTFILLFVLASLATTVFSLPVELTQPLKEASKFFIAMAMGAIGLNTDLVKLVKSGGKPLAMGLACCIAIAVVSLGMQRLLGIW